MTLNLTTAQLHFEIYQELAECYAHLGQTEAASRHYSLARLRAPDDHRPDVGLGCLALQQGQLKEAQEHFTRALSLNPLADDALTGWGRTLLAADDQEAAWEKITLALRYNRDNQEALQLLAQAASHRRQLIEAANLLNNYMTKHGLNLQVLLSLAEVLARLEVFSEAQEALNKVLLFEPDNVKALALQEAIAAALSRWQ